MTREIKKRTRFFFAVEGECEQSFIKWLQHQCDEAGLHVHLDYYSVDGGGYKTTLERGVIYHKRGLTRGPYKASFLLVDEDRSLRGEDWPIEELRRNASNAGLTVCTQKPNLEGILLRLFTGKERTIPDASSLPQQLISLWPQYQKPCDAYTLGRKFTLQDLLRVAQHDPDIAAMLQSIGLINPPST